MSTVLVITIGILAVHIYGGCF